jgi:DNA-binding CsgD family transcriptional regulator
MTAVIGTDRGFPETFSVSIPAQGGKRIHHDREERLALVYRYAVESGGITAAALGEADLGLAAGEVEEAVASLRDRRLLAVEPGSDGLLVAVDPEIAALLLVSPMEQEIYRRRELIAQIQERTESFRRDYARKARPAVEPAPVERVADAVAVGGFLKVAAAACATEILVLQSGDWDAEEFDDFLRVCARQVVRGVSVRIICRHRDRAELVLRRKLRDLTEVGAQVRTVSHVPRAAAIFDGSQAVLLDSAATEPGASCVRVEVVVRFLLDVFEHQWDAATPVDRGEPGYAEAADDLQQSIAALMARGFTDEVMARKLGMSVRTTRRHIAALMQDLGAVSRFQAGARAARRQLVEAV